MAASPVFNMSSDPFVCEEWPHFQGMFHSLSLVFSLMSYFVHLITVSALFSECQCPETMYVPTNLFRVVQSSLTTYKHR